METTTTNSYFAVRERTLRSATRSAVDGANRLAFHAMGTICRVQFRAPNTTESRGYEDALLNWVAQFEAKYSRFLADSLISRINAAAGEHWTDVDPETEQLIGLCHELFFLTRGSFDPTALPLIKLWNWKANPATIPSDAAIQSAKEIVGWSKVQRRKGAIFLPRANMSLDFGGIGKEYAVDRVKNMAAQFGISDVLVDFGQDLAVRGAPTGKPAWHIGLEDPNNPGKCWTGLAVKDKAVATSGDYLRHFVFNGRRYGHIIDPRTGYPVDNGTLAVSVIAPTCTIAGILSTTAFILGPTEGLQLIGNYMGADGCITTNKTRFETRRFHEYVTR
jgi:thiamine biosynthesis lipoprotein